MKLTDEQINQLVGEYKEHCGHMFDDIQEITEEKSYLRFKRICKRFNRLSRF